MPDGGPCVVFRGALKSIVEPKMDVAAYVQEALDGVKDANEAHQGELEVEEIEIVPDDYPTKGQVRHCAKTLAESMLTTTEPSS